MLQSLKIENYALINSLEINFSSGFSTITGETGAGKSVMIGALHLLLGQRAETSVLKDISSKSVIEAHWQLSEYNLQSLFKENDVDYDDNAIIRREILPTGKSRAFVNDMPVNLQFLKDLGERLIDIHSQHQNLLLNSSDFQLSVIDSAAKNSAIFQKYKIVFTDYLDFLKELKELKIKSAKSKETYDFHKFLFEELQQANFKDGEQEELEIQQKQLEHAEEIQTTLAQSYYTLDGGEITLLSQLKTIYTDIKKLTPCFEKAQSLSQRIESTYIELKDLTTEIGAESEHIGLNPEQLAFTQNRLNTLYTLLQKHKVLSIKELIEKKSFLDKELQSADSYSERILELEKKVAETKQQVEQNAIQLSESRTSIFAKIEIEMINLLHNLGIPHAQFKIQNTKTESFTENGIDQISYLFCANKNGTLQNITETASGGELSRVMLCLKLILSRSKALPTIIFDEIDTGVSGDIADKMGEIMVSMSQNMQVLSITHLPQIAVKGKKQYLVYKFDTAHASETNIRLLDKTERVQEIAKMLSGSTLTDAAIENAKQLLQNQ